MLKHWFALSTIATSAALASVACIDQQEEDEVQLVVDEQADGAEVLAVDLLAGCDRTDPDRKYVGMSEAECATIRFYCKEGTTYFADECGCGCATEGEAPERETAALRRETAPTERETPTGEEEQEAMTLCGGVQCDAGEECIGYYGIAGVEGPRFQICGRRCDLGALNDGCPEGKHCVMISDGPGPLCR